MTKRLKKNIEKNIERTIMQKKSLDYNIIIKDMIDRKLSIREKAKELGIPKSTFYNHLTNHKEWWNNEFIELLNQNKKQMSQKGGITKSSKYNK